MSTYAVIYLKGEPFCAVHQNGYLGSQGELLNNLVKRRSFYSWKDILRVSRQNILVYINLKYVRKDYDFCYKLLKKDYPDLYWPYPPDDEFLEKGSDNTETPVTNEWGWGANEDYTYNIVENNVFVRLSTPYFPWVYVDEDLIYRKKEDLLFDILREIYGVVELSDIKFRGYLPADFDLRDKVIKEGPQTKGINLLREAKKTLDIIPEIRESWYYYIGALWAWKRSKEDILNAFDKMFEIAPKYKSGWSLYIRYLKTLGETKLTLNAYKKLLKLKPRSWWDWRNYIRLLIDSGYKEEATRNFKKFVDNYVDLELNRKDPFKVFEIFENNDLSEDLKDLLDYLNYAKVEFYKEKTEKNPLEMNYWMGYAKSLLATGRREKAILALKKAIELFINSSKKYRSIFMRKKLIDTLVKNNLEDLLEYYYQAEIRDFKKKLELSPNDPTIWFKLGKNQLDLNNSNDPFLAFEECIKHCISYTNKNKIKIKVRNSVYKKYQNYLDTIKIPAKFDKEGLKPSKDRLVKEIKKVNTSKYSHKVEMNVNPKNSGLPQREAKIILELEKLTKKKFKKLTYIKANSTMGITMRSQKITGISLFNCGLRNLPKSLGDLRSIRVLNLRKNELENLPSSLKNLKPLEELNISENNFKKLPDWLENINTLKKLIIKKNPLDISLGSNSMNLFLSALGQGSSELNILGNSPTELLLKKLQKKNVEIII